MILNQRHVDNGLGLSTPPPVPSTFPLASATIPCLSWRIGSTSCLTGSNLPKSNVLYKYCFLHVYLTQVYKAAQTTYATNIRN